MTKQITTIKISFPEIKLHTRDAHKLRGYFGSVFKENSALLHNHFDDGNLRYKYPLVQYKVIDKVPTLIAIEEGAKLLTGLFMKITKIDIEGRTYEIRSKNIESKKLDVGYKAALMDYQFKTLWMALNQQNFNDYLQLDELERQKMLTRILIGNILSFYKSIDLRLADAERIMATVRVKEKHTRFKNKNMLVFEGGFTVNAEIPEMLGIGKAVSRGFGTVITN